MARFDGGWIKIYRALGEGDIPQRSTFTLGLFVKLLIMANWKESKAYFGGRQVVLKPGQLLTGLRELSPEADEDPYLHRARRSLSYLELTGRIQQAVSNRGRLITINNWDAYQIIESKTVDDAQSGSNQGAIRAQLSEEGKKGRSKNKTNPGFREEYSQDFEDLWNLYGKVGKKKEAFRAYSDCALAPDEYQSLLGAIKRYLWECKTADRFVMHLSTFLREDWRPYLERSKPAGAELKTTLEDEARDAS